MHYNAEMVRILIKAGAKLDQPNQDKFKPIRLAAKTAISDNDWEAVEAFTEVKDPNDEYSFGSALVRAVYSDKPDGSRLQTVKKLLAAKADLTWDIDGDRALHLAVKKGNFDMVKMLLQAGDDPNKLNKANKTPLECADKSQYWEMVQIFIKKGKEIKSQQIQPKTKADKKQSEVSDKPAAKEGTLFETVLDAMKDALKGNPIAIKALANHYQAKNDYGKAMLFSGLAALYLGPEHPLYAKNRQYIVNFKPNFWSAKKNESYIFLKSFFLDCLDMKENNLSYFAELKNFGFNNPFMLVLFALDNEIAKEKNRQGLLSLNFHQLESIIKPLIEKIIQTIYWRNPKDYPSTSMLRSATTDILKKMDYSAISSGLLAEKFLPKEALVAKVQISAKEVLQVSQVYPSLEASAPVIEPYRPFTTSNHATLFPSPAPLPPLYDEVLKKNDIFACLNNLPPVPTHSLVSKPQDEQVTTNSITTKKAVFV
jgi:hypothetical protein